jgi:hypothetical protein
MIEERLQLVVNSSECHFDVVVDHIADSHLLPETHNTDNVRPSNKPNCDQVESYKDFNVVFHPKDLFFLRVG